MKKKKKDKGQVLKRNKMLILLSSLRYGSEGHVDVVKFHLVETPSILLSYSSIM